MSMEWHYRECHWNGVAKCQGNKQCQWNDIIGNVNEMALQLMSGW